ncbi:MAG: patatin family protein [Flavobacteriales bacterium]|nr:patatin family protein [Flavobacteriales bacterium]
MHKKTLVVQGGGFRSAFSCGVLDAFLVNRYFPFDRYVAVSGGTMALSYFFGGQYRRCLDAMILLSEDDNFLNIRKLWEDEGYMNIDYIHEVATNLCPFDIEVAIRNTRNAKVEFVATNRNAGTAEYIEPQKDNWVDAVIASSALPFATKGSHQVEGMDLMDGGWSDPLPVEHAYETGSKDLIVLQTAPKELKLSQSWVDYFGSIYHKDNPALSDCFENSHKKYNQSIDFLMNPPKDVKVVQIAPEFPLKCGTYSHSRDSIMSDYRYGLDCGLNFVLENPASA